MADLALRAAPATHLVILRRNPARHVQRFVDKLHEVTSYFSMVMPDVWITASRLGAEQLSRELKSTLIVTDSLFVAAIKPDVAGQLHSEEVWEWIDAAKKGRWL